MAKTRYSHASSSVDHLSATRASDAHSGHGHHHDWWSGQSEGSGLAIDPAPSVTATPINPPVEQQPAPIVQTPAYVAPVDPAPIVHTATDPAPAAPTTGAVSEPAPITQTQTQAPTPDSTPSATTPAAPDLIRHDGPIHSEYAGQIIENMDIYVSSGDAITVTDDNVIIRNVRIHHVDGAGVSIQGADHVQLLNSEIINSSPPSGVNPETSENIVNVLVEDSSGFKADHVTVRDGASGFYLLNSPSATLTSVDGYNFHGPEPRGQFIQLDKSGSATIDNFYVHDDPNNSHVEDNISVYSSPNVTIRNGVIDGNNSQSGVGVMFEKGSTGGLVDHVDTVHMGNGSFSSYSDGNVFHDVGAFDNWGGVGPRGANASDSLIFNVSANNLKFEGATYTHPYDSGNIAWDTSRAGSFDIHEDPNATPMTHFANHFDWSV
jgi:hypothetical protein